MSKIFGTDFDKNLYTNIFDEFDFRNTKSFFNQQNTKTRFFFLQLFSLLNHPNFISMFAEVFQKTENKNTVEEIFKVLDKMLDQTPEPQIKILLAFVLSGNPNFVKDAKNKLWLTCKYYEKEIKEQGLSQGTLETLLLVVDSFKDEKKDTINLFSFIQSNTSNNGNSYGSGDDMKQISDNEKLFEITTDEPIEMEKLLLDVGPFMVNKMISFQDNALLSYQLDEKRLALFIMSILKQQNFNEDNSSNSSSNSSINKDTKVLNKILLQSLGSDLYKTIDDSCNSFSNSSSNSSNWNIDNFYKMFKSSIDEMNPRVVLDCFDDPGFVIKDKRKFDLFISCLQKLKILTDPNQLFNLIFRKWNNELNQIEFIEFILNTPQLDYLSFKSYNGKKVKKNIELNTTVTKSNNGYLIDIWSCIELIEVLLKLSSGNYYVKVKKMFEWPIQNIPEIIGLGLVAIKPASEDFLYDALIQEVLTLFLGNHMNSFTVIEEVWNTNKDLVIRTISNMYNSFPDLMNLSRILDITQKLKDSLLLLVNCDDYNFAVHLAILAVKRDFLHIEQWLKERIETVGDDFIKALLVYIKDNLIAHCGNGNASKQNILEKSQLSLDSLGVIFENLVNAKPNCNAKVSQKTEEEIKAVYKSIFELFDELQLSLNSQEVEDIANSIFKKMFKEETTVYDTIEKLKRYKDSSDQKEREIYACMIHCLLDEYRFYYQYPEKQLSTVSTLFGEIINHKLIDGVIETIALKYILEGIQKGAGPMFVFGTTALSQFIDKLSELPSYLKSLVEIKALQNNPMLYEKVLEKYKTEMGQTQQQQVTHTQQQQQQQTQSQTASNTSSSFLQPPKLEKSFDSSPRYAQQQNMNVGSMNRVGFNSGNSLMDMDMNSNDNNNNNNSKSKMMKMGCMPKDYNPMDMNNPNQQMSSFFMNNQMMDQLYMGMNVHKMQQQQQQPKNNVQLGNLSMSSITGGTNDDDNKSFKSYQHMANMYGGMNMNESQSMQSMQPQTTNTSGILNSSSSNLNNMSGISASSPKRPQQKTKLSRPQQNLNNLGEVLGLDNERMTPPNPDLLDTMKFMFNSMSKSNVADKANELKLLLRDDTTTKWFSSFFIVNRVGLENNNHLLYNELITMIDHKELMNYLIKDTIHFIHKLLKSDTVDKDMKEKAFLKNLGSWLGLMTVNKNKPILAKDLDLKEVIFEAYTDGKLTAIVCFVSKILEHSVKTKVFHAKNPWLQAILSLLSELRSKPNLKQNLVFEIESLFNKLGIDRDSYPKSKLLDRLKPPENSPDFPRAQQQQQQQHMQMPVDQSLEKINVHELYNKINSMDSYIINLLSNINSHSPQAMSKQELVSLLTKVLSDSINLIIGPVVERAVNISLVTTKELVIKDFLFDMDENKFKHSASNCIKSLAGSLALVTCKEPLRINYITNLKEIFQEKNIDTEGMDLNSNQSSADLLEIGCSYIHNYVIKKAIEKIQNDSGIIEEIERRKRRKPFDNKSDHVNKARALPEVLRPRPDGLTAEQFLIYENYDKIYESYKKQEYASKGSSALSLIVKIIKEVLDLASGTSSSKLTKSYEICMCNIQGINIDSAGSFDDGSNQATILQKCITDCKCEDEKLQTEFANISFKYAMNAFKRKNIQLLNIFTTLIKGWIVHQPKITESITNNLFTKNDILARFNVDLHSYFIKKSFISFPEYEDNLYDNLENPVTRKACLKFILELISRNEISSSKFEKIKPFMLDPNLCNCYFTFFAPKSKLPSNLNKSAESIIDYKKCNIKDVQTYRVFSEMCCFAFNQIVDTVNPFLPAQFEVLKKSLKKFLQSPFISNEEQNNVFIMIITELCVKAGSDRAVDKNKKANYYYPENEAKAIYALLSVVGTESLNKLKMFSSNDLFGIFKTFHHDYLKSCINFNQRPYYKLFYNLIHLLCQHKNQDELFNSGYKKINYLFHFGDFLRQIAPIHYPGFALAWLDLISCKHLVSSFLEPEPMTKTKDNIHKYEKYLYLIIDLFSFLKQIYNNQITDFAWKEYLEKVYKFMFILCNTYPEFISNYYYIMIVSLPPGTNYIQLKNLILSKGPKEIEQPDPFGEDSKDISSPEKRKNAYILFDIASILEDSNYKGVIDSFVDTKSEAKIEELSNMLNAPRNKEFHFYVINAIVIYWAQKVIKQLNEKNIKVSEVGEYFIKLLTLLDPENRDHLINSMLNELRFPSNQTIVFSYLMLFILSEIKNDVIEEHIIRNLIGRLIYKPIPWGVVCFFVQVMKNKKCMLLLKKPYIIKNKADELLQKLYLSVKNDKLKNFIPAY